MSAQEPLESTPATRRREKVRGAILDAAERVFAREGEAGLSIRRLAEEIDYSPSAIYKYFGSKEELIDELKEAFFARLLARIEDDIDTTVPFADRARQCVQTYVETALERPHHYAAAFSGVPTLEIDDESLPDWAHFQTTRKGQAFQILIDMVREGQALGEIDPALHFLFTAKSVWASSHGLAQLLINLPHFPRMLPEGPDSPPEGFVSFHADMVWRSLRPIETMTPSNTPTETGPVQ